MIYGIDDVMDGKLPSAVDISGRRLDERERLLVSHQFDIFFFFSFLIRPSRNYFIVKLNIYWIMQKKAATRDFNACNDRSRTDSGQSQNAPIINSRVITFHFAGLSITSLTSLAYLRSMRSKKPRQDYPNWKLEFRLFNFAGRCVRQQEKIKCAKWAIG